jgi:hypothetical protein
MNLNEEVELLAGVPIFSKVEPAKLNCRPSPASVNFTAGRRLPPGRSGRHDDVVLAARPTC